MTINSNSKIKVTFLAIILVACFKGFSQKSSKKVTYIGINGKEQDMQIYFPKNHKKTDKKNCFVFFHGGGWTKGNLTQGNEFCRYLADRGMVAITANYSMHEREKSKNLPNGESKKRICVTDGKTVVRWVKEHHKELGIDPNNIVAGGVSAGGHISVMQMMDTKFNNPKDNAEIETDVKALVLICPAFTTLNRDRTPEVNVFNHLDKTFPPMLFIVGETDKWKKASDVLVEKLKEKKNVDLELWVGLESPHMFYRKKEWMDSTILTIDNFLTKRGFLEGAPKASLKGNSKSLVKR